MARNVGGASRLYLETLFEQGTSAGLTDGQLLERFATGGGDVAEQAFAVLVERHGPMVLRVCRGVLRDDHEAMDAFQATFLILVRKGRSLWVRDSLGPWLHRVACRAAGRARAQAARRRALEQRVAEMPRASSASGDRDGLARALHDEVDRLPERYRAAIVLCDLEGRTCEEAARHLGCPIGTIGSRLARGRERLRSRLTRRGLAPGTGVLSALLAAESRASGLPAVVAHSTARLGRCAGTGKAVAGTSSAASVTLAEDVLRSLFMTKFMTAGGALMAALVVFVTAAETFRSGVSAQVPAIAAEEGAPRRAEDPFHFMNDNDRVKHAAYVEIGNMRPVIQDERGIRFQSRQAVLYEDGTAKLWSLEQKDPVAPPLQQQGPIRELTFFDEANLLVTRSDDAVKVWDALTGAPRKELDGQSIWPMWLSFAPGAKRFVTSDREAVTVWDAVTLNAVATVRPAIGARGIAAGLSSDGKTVVTFRFGKEPSAELWDVTSGRVFATLSAPSQAVADAFADDGAKLNKAGLDREAPFWKVVRSLAPSARAAKP